MTYKIKAIVFTKDNRLSAALKDYLFRSGLRETAVIQEPKQLTQFILDGYWPIVFIEHIDGVSDGFDDFGRLYKVPGLELLSYIFVAPVEQKKYIAFTQSVGARSFISKPIVPIEAERVIKSVNPPLNDPAITLAYKTSSCLIRGDITRAVVFLTQLKTVAAFNTAAEIALARCEMATGQHSKAEERLDTLQSVKGGQINILAEKANYFKKKAMYADALTYYKNIRDVHPNMTVYVWDQIILHLDMDEVDEAAVLLDELIKEPVFKELALEGLARIMIFMGLAEHIPLLLKTTPTILKQFELFTTASLVAKV